MDFRFSTSEPQTGFYNEPPSMKRAIIPLLLFAIVGIISFYCLDFILLRMGNKIDAPDGSNDAQISFYAIGDQGSGTYRQYLTAAKMELSCRSQRDVNFTLFLGDNFYWAGVKSVRDDKFSELFEEAYGSTCLLGMPYYAVLGNHDYKSVPFAQVEYSRKGLGSGRWNMPDTTYVKDFGKIDGVPLIRLVVLDTQSPIENQLALLKKAFSNDQKVVWKMVAAHKVIRSHSEKYRDNDYLVKKLLPTLKTLGVHVYFSGHAHNLQLVQKEGEPVYVVSGAGGKAPRSLVDTSDADLLYGKAQNGFVKVNVTKNQTTLKFITLFSSHTFEIYRQCMEQNKHKNCVRNLE